eukprot:SAG11_NODE_21443_length_425_cov_0.625767_1_plen_29_part_01
MLGALSFYALALCAEQNCAPFPRPALPPP